MRDPLYILNVLLNLGGGPKPELVATDNASYSDIVFGLFRLLGYQFSPRIADLSDQRFWRLEVPGVPPGDYGPLNALARHKVTTPRMITHAQVWHCVLQPQALFYAVIPSIPIYPKGHRTSPGW